MLSTSHPQLLQNIPNPFRGYTEIGVYLPAESEAELTVFNAIGEKVETLYTGKLQSGKHLFKFETNKHEAGIYFYRLVTPEFSGVKAMEVIK